MMHVIGLMSGTSVDGVDAVLVDIDDSEAGGSSREHPRVRLIAAATYPYPDSLRSHILDVCHGAALSLVDLAVLDDRIAVCFAEAALQIQTDELSAQLIGSHGQTVYHRPPAQSESCPLGYTLQLGRGALIAHLTQIPTVSNFRVADMAVGGQGAPMVSAVDAWLLRHPTHYRCVQNLGGIGNVTYLPATQHSTEAIIGWDTGPANSLLDLAVQFLSQGDLQYDRDGRWAAQGTPCQPLVNQWLQHEFFQQPPPKSTGRELFGQAYFDRCLQDAQPYDLAAADLLATLTEFTAASVAHSYRLFIPQFPDQVLLCGGGSRNHYLRERLQAHLHPAVVTTTDEFGLNADYREAIAFAVLAYWRHQHIPGNLPEVTGARQKVLLGEIHLVA